MPGIEAAKMPAEEKIQYRGWRARRPRARRHDGQLRRDPVARLRGRRGSGPGTRRSPSACSRCRATFASTAPCSRRWGPAPREVRLPADLDGLDGARHPRRREHHHRQAHAALRPDRARSRRVAGRHAGVRHLRRAHHRGARDRRGRPAAARPHRHRGPAQRLRPSGAQLRGRSAVAGLAGAPPLRAVFIRAPWIERAGPGVEVLAEPPRARRRGARGRRAGHRLPPGAHRRYEAA